MINIYSFQIVLIRESKTILQCMNMCSQNLNYFLKLLNTWLPSKYVTCILSLNVYLHNDYCQHLVLCTGLFYILMNYFSK